MVSASLVFNCASLPKNTSISFSIAFNSLLKNLLFINGTASCLVSSYSLAFFFNDDVTINCLNLLTASFCFGVLGCLVGVASPSLILCSLSAWFVLDMLVLIFFSFCFLNCCIAGHGGFGVFTIWSIKLVVSSLGSLLRVFLDIASISSSKSIPGSSCGNIA